jgi:glycosyltransferase involved in cell wall biosynthesis
MKDGLVSVVVTTYYRNDGLEKALDEILAQTYSPLEVIVVDDSAEEYARDVVAAYPDVEYVPHQVNTSQLGAWNTGVEFATGEYVQFHDDDDWLFETKIERQVERLRENPDAGTVYCGFVTGNGEERRPDPDARGQVLERALRHTMPGRVTTTMLTRADLIEAVFPLPELPSAGDLLLTIELAARTEFDALDELLVHRESPPDNLGGSLANRRSRLRIIREHSDLYDSYPEIKRETLARSYFLLGRKQFTNALWSPRAIASLLKANYYSPSLEREYLLYFAASWFGYLGLLLGRSLPGVSAS